MKVIYVAGKFRGANAWDVECNIRVAEQVALGVAACGASPMCPHTNTRFFNGTMTEQFWLDATMELLRRCDAVVCCPNWRDSQGALKEVEEALLRDMPVFYSVGELANWVDAQWLKERAMA